MKLVESARFTTVSPSTGWRHTSSVIAEVRLDVEGLGVVLHSPSSTDHIGDGEDYLGSQYWEPEQVEAHVRAGSIVGIGTGTPGTFVIRVHLAPPDEAHISSVEVAIRLALQSDGVVVFRDLYDLMEWDSSFVDGQAVEVPPGPYRLTVTTKTPASGVLGDDQVLDVFFEPVDQLPIVNLRGVPQLIPE